MIQGLQFNLAKLLATGFNRRVGVYYVTFTVVEWLPVFIDESACKIITDSLNFCVKQKSLGVNAYVIMHTHLHAILFDVEFNAENHLISVTVSSQTTQFIYNGDGNLVKKIKPDGSKTIYPSTTPRKACGSAQGGPREEDQARWGHTSVK